MKNVLRCIMFCAILILASQGKLKSYADEMGDVMQYGNVSSDVNDMYGYSASVYSYEEEKEVNELVNAKVTEILLSEDSLNMESNGCVKYIDVIGILEDGNYVNLSRQVSVIFCDEDIATYDCGRVDAEGMGTTTIYMSYDTYQFSVNVTVEKEVDWEEYHNALVAQLSRDNERKVPGPQLSLVMTKRAGDMMFVEWVAKKDFTMNDGSVKIKDTTIKGVPYSLKSDVYDAEGFMEKYNEYDEEKNDNGFYDILPRKKNNKTVYDAAYGVDCSGFVSFAWGISRHTTADFRSALANGSNRFVKIGTYSYDGKNYNKEELKTAYLSLTVGDAIVTDGHCRLISSNDTERKKVIVNEASGNTPSIHSYTYDDLANEGYLPFTITEDYFNSFDKNK